MKRNTAFAVGATAGLAVVALLAVLRSDSIQRRERQARARSARYQLDRWAGEGGQAPDDPDVGFPFPSSRERDSGPA